MDKYKISSSALLTVLQGIAVATELPESSVEALTRCFSVGGISSCANRQFFDDPSIAISFWDWGAVVSSMFCKEEKGLQHIANVALSIAFLRDRGRDSQEVMATDLKLIWSLIHDALTSMLFGRPLFKASRSAQGFLAIPLCSLVEEGNIIELFRLHVWLPDGQRGNESFAVHSHQPFGQSWVLAGEGTDYSFDVQLATDFTVATHAKYHLAWNDGIKLGTSYKTHQISSTVVNSGKLVRVTPRGSEVHTRNMSYTIPTGAFHRTEVMPETLHATIFFFDASRGFLGNAPVLGPKDMDSSTQLRDPAGITAAELACMVDAVRLWEMFMERGQQYTQRAEWEHALREFSNALHLCGQASSLPNVGHYKNIVLGELGKTNRRFGRYKQAEVFLESALQGMGLTPQHIDLSGELAVVYRHMGRLTDAKRALVTQYDMAKELKLEHAVCRSIGNLGMVNYQMSQQTSDKALLELAIHQLTERVQRARHLKSFMAAERANEASVWETIGLSRLSLCYMARGNPHEATKSGLESLKVAIKFRDPTVIAMSRFFYGRSLLLDGQRKEALQQFNPSGTCTPAMAFCKEPSEENLLYLRELIDMGADLDLVDEQGYTALDYAVFSRDKGAEQLILEGLRRQLQGCVESQILQRQTEARLRKGYRELFQESLRPVLLDIGVANGLQNLRRVYATMLATDQEKRSMFDQFKFVWYSAFVNSGRLPRSDDGFTQHLKEIPQNLTPECVLFFSYRWINSDPGATSPDDNQNTQYRRMVRAAEAFLSLYPCVNPRKLGIWLDYACIDQDNPSPGVSALPVILAQCDAVISLLDDEYHKRAWCSLEVAMAQTLRKSYHLHSWYEHTKESGGDWVLQEGPHEFEPVITNKQLRFEEDRPRILFLERQIKLFGQT